ncbi:hypothetical protein EYF80_016582 [Liparis tanakae]|uniref:Uncharacterized protein n=1 Tax=Liparis tanakae TaxID=230148 RepID=A0A4Z2I4V2_9TELE|nr:hypothetical protein EYF80_016582 [Liparis tanakae]
MENTVKAIWKLASTTIAAPTATAGYRGPERASPGPGIEDPRMMLTKIRVPSSSARMARQNCRLRSSREKGAINKRRPVFRSPNIHFFGLLRLPKAVLLRQALPTLSN